MKTCPECKKILEIQDFWEENHSADEISPDFFPSGKYLVMEVMAECPKCHKAYKWKSLFIKQRDYAFEIMPDE